AEAGLAKAGLAKAGLAKAGLAEAGLAEAGLALTNSGGNELLAKGLAVIALAGVSAGAGTIALHATSSHHPRAEAPRPAKTGSPHRILPSARHPGASLPWRRPPTPSIPPVARVALPPARSDAPVPGASDPVAAGETRGPTPTRTAPARRM